MIHWLDSEEGASEEYPLGSVEYIMSWIGLAGSVITILILLALVKPMRKSMEEDVFLKIGGNRDKLMLFRYKSFTSSFIKIDFINSVLFMTTAYFFWYCT